jgi:hypothetical protein
MITCILELKLIHTCKHLVCFDGSIYILLPQKDMTNILHKIRHSRENNQNHPLKLGDNCVLCTKNTSMCIGYQ